MQPPSIVIVGRPNVGKSTLFNAILKSRRSIVGDEPGITRDRIHGKGVHRRRRFELIDTGGIVPDDEAMIPTEILRQARMAFDVASQIIFLVDGRSEITRVDRDLADLLRRLGTPVTLAVNKIDTPKSEGLTHEFYRLGFENLFPVSAEHNLGLRELMDHVTAEFPAEPSEAEKAAEKEAAAAELEAAGEDGEDTATEPEAVQIGPIKVAIIGRPNVGKSTLLNSLTGVERAIVSPMAGTTRDAVDETVVRGGIEYAFVDTAGIRRKGKTKLMAEKLSVVMARRHLRMSNVAVIVLDATEGVLSLDATISGYAHEEGRAVVLCVNKWDLVADEGKAAKGKMNRQKLKDQIAERLKFLDYARIVFLSAKSGKGVEPLFVAIRKSFEAANIRIGTGELNRFVETLQWEYAQKIRYVTQASVRPPTFIAFTDKARKLHFSAERNLSNRLRERFGFEGTPIVVKSKAR